MDAIERPGSAQERTVGRILTAAARLFAARGLAGVGLREITAEAGVNLAAVNYHFGSKERLLEALFLRRARPITEERLRLLALCREAPGRPPMLEQLLEAFLRPAFSLGLEAGVDGATFGRLRARLSVESEDLYRRILSQAFNASTRAFLDAVAAALPDLPRAEVEWRFHFMLGTMIYTMADSGRIQSVGDGLCRPGEVETALARLVPFLCAGFRAPPT
ncbi:TetR/AcrR family transcriptional regulator [Paracraurococcus lichenis]|uniref:TetR/AcrR family transcriptional regulator n=1 Tax=Paracraurococcus lichenis TaxID=3064888 RepID=A0ABT9DTC8_9PROT|nr:TetR/AcrR family transcriptional regulator [Paracraurococcus sp. LOR1-02]MDO9707136.1 TetR/AcrR family transcriptional regulator [Paracraurococcus sp. LOR1-02]